ncbi:MAG: 5'-3' exonuclease H3TH domain-containing protein [Pseudomonadota bacterium]
MLTLIFDGLNLIRRVHAGMQRVDASGGQGDASLMDVDDLERNVVRSADRALRHFSPTHAMLAMDGRGGGWRKAVFDDYKANRAPMPDSLNAALPRLEAALASAGVRALRVGDFEADDIIASVAHALSQHGRNVVILSTDKSMLSLLRPGVRVWHHFENRELTAADVHKRFGVEPLQLADFLALAGDSSQNVPGVRGIGSKTAAQLLAAHGTVEGVLEAAEQLTRRQRENLMAQREEVLLYKQISTLRDDVRADVNLSDFRLASRAG